MNEAQKKLFKRLNEKDQNKRDKNGLEILEEIKKFKY